MKGRTILSYLIYQALIKRLDGVELNETERRTDIREAIAKATPEQMKILEDEAETILQNKVLPQLTVGVFEERCGYMFMSVNDDSFFIISLKQKLNGATNIVLYADSGARELDAKAYVF